MPVNSVLCKKFSNKGLLQGIQTQMLPHMKVVHKIALLLLLLLLLSNTVQAQEYPDKPAYTFQVWGHNEGLPASSIASITTSEEGYLWFGTGEGIVRFDGDQFTVYHPGNTPEISEKIFHAVTTGSDGNLWAANINELVKIQNGKLQAIPFDDGLLSHNIFAIKHFPDNSIWLGSGGDGIIEYRDGFFTAYTDNDGLAGNYIEEIVTDHNGTIWIATRTGLSIYENGEFQYPEEFDELHNIDLRTLLADTDGNLWVGSQNRGLFRINRARNEVTRFYTGNGLSGNTIHALTEAEDGIIWAGTNGNGLNRIHDDTIYQYRVEDGLPSNLIFSLYYSDEGILWTGTAGAGLTQLRRSVIRSFSIEDGLSSNFVLPIFQQDDGTIWVGTGGSGLNRIRGDEVRHFTESNGLSHNLVFTVYGQADGTIWAGTANGLNRIRGENITVFREEDGLWNNSVHAVFEDSDGFIWFGTSGGGLQKYDGITFESIILPDGYSDATWSSFNQDSNGNIWVGSHGYGALKINSDTVHTYNEGTGLPSDLVLDFYEDENNFIWIATRNGLVRYDNDSFETFDINDGLLYNDIFRILADDEQTLWTCSNWGVQFFSLKDIERYRKQEINNIPAHLLTTNDGLPSRECNGGIYPAGWVMQNGEFWFPTTGGAAVFNPDDIEIDTTAPKILIESLTKNDQLYFPDENPELEPGTRAFEIKYTALEYLNPERVRFRYRLRNFDDQWVEANDRRIAYYTALGPGTYHFELISSKASGIWSETPASFTFTIKPHFYETRTFYALIFLLLFFAGFAVQQLRRIKVNRDQLRKLVDQRTGELRNEIEIRIDAEKELEKSLEEKTILLKEIHHRVKNNLAVINALFHLQVNKTENREAIDLLTDSQHRIQTIAAIHDQLYQTELFSSLEMENFIKKLVSNISQSFQNEEKTIKSELDLENITLNMTQAIPCGLLLNEMITNAYKHAFKGRNEGTIFVTLKSGVDNRVHISVSDNGVGIDKGVTDSGSIGMTLIKTLTNQLRGKLEIKSENGTKIEITFKREEVATDSKNQES